MHISLNWIKDFVDIPKKLSPEELGQLLTLKTAEVEGVESEAEKFANMVSGKVVKLEKHPDADSLQIAQVDIGDEVIQLVCGGANLKKEMAVAVTKIGAKVQWHGKGELITLEKVKIRGVESFGMIAASSEIGLNNPNEGEKDILDLSDKEPKPGTPLSELFEKNDYIFEIDNKSLTHRPDLWGHYGMAREVAAITETRLKPIKPNVSIPSGGEQIEVEVKDSKLCPRFCALVIKNIKVQESPDWLRSRLQAIGHGVHSNIVDVTNYVMAEIGQPMHAFDKEKIDEKIIVRRAEEGERLTTLDGKERKLTKTMGVVADQKNAVSVAGIIGGANSEIDNNTTTIILEAANWHPSILRRASIELGVRTDAVQRFEKSLDPNLPELAIKRAAEIILEICPEAEIAGPMTDIKNFDNKAIQIELDPKKAISKIGIELSPKEIKEILENLEFKVEEGDLMKVTVPSFRATKDINIEDDLIEEIARIYGYDNIQASIPSLPAKLPSENTERLKKHRARELFSYGLGFDEVYNYSFYGKSELSNSLMTEEAHVKLLNYLSADQTHMRTSLIPNLLKNLQHNIKYQDEFSIYEIGRSYKEIGDFMPLEEKQIAGAILIKGNQEKVFYEAKGSIEAFLKKFTLKNIEAKKGIDSTPYAHPNQALTYIDQNAQTIAKVFNIHPLVSKNHGLDKYSIALFEINFTEAMKLKPEEEKYKSIPKFPSIIMDISVVIDKNKEIAEIQKAIEKADPKLILKIELFDVYKGENVEKNKKAVAFKITLQTPTRTLTDQDMSAVQLKIFKNLETIGGQIRGK